MVDPAIIAEETQTTSLVFHSILGLALVALCGIFVRMLTMQRTRIRRMTPMQRREHDEVMEDLKIY